MVLYDSQANMLYTNPTAYNVFQDPNYSKEKCDHF